MIDLANGNHVVSSGVDQRSRRRRRRRHVGNGSTGTVGPVGPGKSLLGGTAGDLVGASQGNPDVTPLANDNCVGRLIADVTGYFPSGRNEFSPTATTDILRERICQSPAYALTQTAFRRGTAPAELRQPKSAATETNQPTEPSICNSIRRLHSTAYSIGRVRVTGSMKPLTTMPIACSWERPRLIR